MAIKPLTQEHKDNISLGSRKSGIAAKIGETRIYPSKPYRMIKICHGKSGKNWMLEHRYVMEQKLGRKLESTEIVHHLDGDDLNNHEENLVLIDKYEHGVLNRMLPYCKDDPSFVMALIKTLQAQFPNSGEL